MDSGVYQMSFRGLSVREAWRFGREPFKFCVALVLKALAVKGAKLWLPPHECEVPCAVNDLSPRARDALQAVATAAEALGYRGGGFLRMTRILDPNTREVGVWVGFHADGTRGLFAGFVVNAAGGRERAALMMTGAVVTESGENHEFLNHHQHMDNGGLTRKHQVRAADVEEMDAAMVAFIGSCRQPVRHFESAEAFRHHVRRVEEQAFDSRVARGLFRPCGAVADDSVPALPVG